MNRARPLLLILLAAVGLTVGFYYLSNQDDGGPATVPTAKILVATDEIGYAEPLVLPHTNGEGEKVKGNCQFANWPRNLLPEGHVNNESTVKDKTMVTRVRLVGGMPVLKEQIVARDEFKPADKLLIQMQADRTLITTGDLRPGVNVNIIYLDANEQFAIMRCVEIYAIGGITSEGLPQEFDPGKARSVWLLIPREYYTEMLQYKQRYGQQLRVMRTPPEQQCAGGAVMVRGEDEPDVDAAVAALKAARRRQEIIDQATSLAEQGNYREAITTLRTADSLKAAELVSTWEDKLVQRIYQQASQAVEAGDLEQAEQTLSQIDELHAAYARVRELRQRIQQLRAEADHLAAYRELLQQATSSTRSGDFPAARAAIDRLQDYAEEDYQPGGELPAATDAVEAARGAIEEAEGEFELHRNVLRARLRQNSCDKAREKLEEIKEDFPEHPEVKNLEQDVLQCERGGQ